MADNVTVTEGTGTTIAADEISGVKHQRVKIQHGADGSATDVSSASPLPVDLGSNNDVTVTGTVDLGATDNAVLDTIASNTGGLLTDTELRATPVPISGSVTADLGANNDVTVTSGTVTANAGTNLNTSALALESGGNLETIAGDTTSIDGKITACNTGAIAGTVTANLSATDNAVLDDIAAKLATIDADTSALATQVPTVDSYTHAAISASANTANQSLVAAPGASKQIWVYGIQFTVGTGDGSASFQDEDDTAISGVMPFAENSGMAQSPSGNFAMPLWKVATNKALEVDTVTCDIKGSIQYAIVSV